MRPLHVNTPSIIASPVNLDALGVRVAPSCRLLSQTGVVRTYTSLSLGVEVAVAAD